MSQTAEGKRQNGHYAQWTARLTVVMLILQLITVILFVYGAWLILRPTLFSSYVPQKVLTPHVPLAGAVKIESTKCNLTEGDLIVGNITYWIREQPSYVRIQSNALGVERGVIYRPGCQSRTFENQVPEMATLGTWHIEGSNTVRDASGREQTVGYHTESFEIVP